MTFEDFVKQELKWEEYRQANPTCDNCADYYEDDCGPCCKRYGCVEEEYTTKHCGSWR